MSNKYNAFIYISTTILQKLIPFLLLPVFVKVMDIEDYGNYGLYISIWALTSIFIGLKPNTYLIKSYNENSNFDIKVSSCLIIAFVSTFLVFPIVYFSFGFVFESNYQFSLSVIAVLSGFLLSIKVIYESYLQALNLTFSYATFQLAVAFFVPIGTISALYLIGSGFLERVYYDLILNFIILLAFLFIGRNIFTFTFNEEVRQDIGKTLRFLLPLSVHTMAFVLLNLGDRILIDYFLNVEDVAKYTVAYSLGMIMGFISEGVIKAWNVYFYREVKKSVADETIVFKKCIEISVVMIITGLIVGLVISNTYTLFFPGTYVGLSGVICVICFSYSFEGVRKMFCSYLYLYNETKIIARYTVLSVVINILLNLLLIPYFGIMGSAIATLFSFLVLTLLTVYKAVNLRKVRFINEYQ